MNGIKNMADLRKEIMRLQQNKIAQENQLKMDINNIGEKLKPENILRSTILFLFDRYEKILISSLSSGAYHLLKKLSSHPIFNRITIYLTNKFTSWFTEKNTDEKAGQQKD